MFRGYTFEDFELDESRFELRRADHRLAVQPKVLRLLLLLVRERHRALSDVELMANLWPEETVSRASIKRAVMGARKALGDRGQSAIRTVRGHGYQFMLAAENADRAAEVADGFPASATTGPSPDFVGRTQLLASLDEDLRATLAARGGCVVVVGQPGIGKTRFLHELARGAGQLDMEAWFGHCMEFDGAPPFWPLTQIMRRAADMHGAGEAGALAAQVGAELAAAFPILKERLPEAPSILAADAADARFRLFDDMVGLFGRISQRRPLLLLIDDLHCADEPSLRWLRFASRQFRSMRVLIVATMRRAEGRESAMSELLGAITREGASRCVELDGLSSSEVARLVEQRCHQVPPPDVVAALHDRTAGNPLFLEQLLRQHVVRPSTLPDGAGQAPTDADWLWVVHTPRGRGIDTAIEHHLGSLSERCRALLLEAAVLGREFRVGPLAALAGRSATDVIARLDEAHAAGVVYQAPGAIGCYRFTHALIRDALYGRLDAFERATQHARAAAALEMLAAHPDDAQLSEITEHYLSGVPVADAARAVAHAQRAAARAMVRFAYEEATRLLGRALQVHEMGDVAPATRLALLLARGKAMALSACRTEARGTLLEAVALARALEDTDTLAAAAALLAEPRESGAVDVEQVDALRAALGALPEDDLRVPGLQALLAKSLSYSSARDERRAMASSALSLTRKLGDPALRARGLRACHEALTEPEQLSEREAISDELERMAQQFSEPRYALDAAVTRFQNNIERGDVAGLRAAVATLEGFGPRVVDPVARWYTQIFRSTLAYIEGDFRQAERHALAARDLGSLVGDELAYHSYCVQMNGVLRMQGRMGEAETTAREMSLRYPSLTGWRAVVGAIDADLERVELARKTLAQVADPGLVTLRRDPYLLSALCPVAELCSAVGSEELARTIYDALCPYEGHHGNVSFGGFTYGPVSLVLARLAIRMREADLAMRHSRAGIATAEAMPSATFVMFGRIALARALRLGGRSAAQTEAVELLGQAKETAEARGLAGIEFLCAALLADKQA